MRGRRLCALIAVLPAIMALSAVPAAAQVGVPAEAVRANVLGHIRLPPGFRIELFAMAPGARALAVGEAGTVFVGTRQSTVWAAVDKNRDGVAEQVAAFAPGTTLNNPNGVCLDGDGTLFVAETNRVLAFPAAESAVGADPAPRAVVADGKLIPSTEQSRGHSARVCVVGPDGKLYVALGQPYNVSPPDKVALYREAGIGGIIRMDRDGSRREVVATGIRNSVGLAFNPANGQLWFTDNQVDGMGDDIPPGELNRLTAIGQDFGFPWYGGGHTRTREYQNATPPEGVVFPEVEMVAHAADLGMMFYTGARFPAKYRGGVFNAQHGSWNRSRPVGARVMFTALKADGSADRTEVFADGWLEEATGRYRGRPVDVKQYGDGSILVSDDRLGAVYRIGYAGP